MTDTTTDKGAPKGAGSFCIPRAALNALIDNQATVYEICAYLTLAKSTDASGCYSTASISAVNRSAEARKNKNGPVDRALQRLKTIRATTTRRVSNGRTGKAHAWIEEKVDLGPILYDREGWLAETGEVLPDGPFDKAKVRHVLPDFDEPPEDRVWFGNNLVSGIGSFKQPLKALKNAGDVAARLLLALYELNDMEVWGGVRPVSEGHGPWVHYEPVAEDSRFTTGARLHRAKNAGSVGNSDLFSRVCPLPGSGDWWAKHEEAGGPVWRALEALESSGLIYEVVMALNRDAIKKNFVSGNDYSDIPEDAEPLYELDCLSKHGYKPEGEEGIAWATAKTASDFGYPVTREGGTFDGTYAALVPRGYGVMIAGIYRLRFRVSNPKNVGVRGAWAGIHQRARDGLELVNNLRVAAKKEPLTSPYEPQTAPEPTPLKVVRTAANVYPFDAG